MQWYLLWYRRWIRTRDSGFTEWRLTSSGKLLHYIQHWLTTYSCPSLHQPWKDSGFWYDSFKFIKILSIKEKFKLVHTCVGWRWIRNHCLGDDVDVCGWMWMFPWGYTEDFGDFSDCVYPDDYDDLVSILSKRLQQNTFKWSSKLFNFYYLGFKKTKFLEAKRQKIKNITVKKAMFRHQKLTSKPSGLMQSSLSFIMAFIMCCA